MAKKPKLTQRQKRQVAQNRQRRLHKTKPETLNQAMTHHNVLGRVVGRFGKQADVEYESRIVRCHIRRTIDSVVCGDWVLFSFDEHSQESVTGIIEIVKDRKRVLTRPDFYDGIKPVAANIDFIIIVSSVVPAFSSHIIDRYLVACEDLDIQPLIVVNKIEMADDTMRKDIATTLKTYREIGYDTLLTSCKTGKGIDLLLQRLDAHTSIVVGQSGVGKSSLINQILPEAEELVGDVSSGSGLGQHTTTASKLLHLPAGGDLIDSPGVREFGLWHLPEDRVTWAFREFRDYIGGCKFRDCKHLDEPGCLIRQAAEKGDIAKARLDSYHRIISSMQEQKPAYI